MESELYSVKLTLPAGAHVYVVADDARDAEEIVYSAIDESGVFDPDSFVYEPRLVQSYKRIHRPSDIKEAE